MNGINTAPEDLAPTRQPADSHLANPKIRLTALIIAALIAAAALWVGISHRYTQALNDRNAAVADAMTAFEDNQKARQDGSQLLPKTLGDLMFTKGTDRLKLLLSKENPYCNTQLSMPEPETREIALAQAEVARVYLTECEQHTRAVRDSIQEAKIAALRNEAGNADTRLTTSADFLQLYVDDEMYLDKDLHLKKEAQALIDLAYKQKENIKTALKNNQNDQLDTLITDAEKIVTEIKSLQGKMDQARSEWTQRKHANRAANSTFAPAAPRATASISTPVAESGSGTAVVEDGGSPMRLTKAGKVKPRQHTVDRMPMN